MYSPEGLSDPFDLRFGCAGVETIYEIGADDEARIRQAGTLDGRRAHT